MRRRARAASGRLSRNRLLTRAALLSGMADRA